MNQPQKDQLRYYPFGHYLRQRFGCRVQKITIDAGFSCPNREGRKPRDGCVFCNNTGFSPNTRVDAGQVREQLEQGISRTRQRSRASRFIAYFQAYSNTFGSAEHLKSLYDQVWDFPEVVGLSIGTRPDCVDQAKINLIADQARHGEVWIEYGLQSAHDETLERINRGHSYQHFLDAVDMTRDRGIRICAHTILGLPGEDRDMMLETHRQLAELPIDGIKIHLLHVMRDTVLEDQYKQGHVAMLERQAYVSLLCDVLELLPPTVVIQRMHADAPRDVLVAPQWCLDKSGVLNDIKRELADRQSWQGKALGFKLTDIPAISSATTPA
jgi:hypothetical protein